MGQTLDCLAIQGIQFTQPHRPKEAIPDSYDKCEPIFNLCFHLVVTVVNISK